MTTFKRRYTTSEVVTTAPITLTAVSGVITPDASASTMFRHVAAANVQLAEPTNGADDGEQITVEVQASGGARTLSFADGTDSVSIPSGTWWVGRLIYHNTGDLWVLDDSTSGGGGSGAPPDGTVTNASVASNAAISLDKTADTASRVAMTPAERTKLTGLPGGQIVTGYLTAGSTSATVTHAMNTTDLVASVHTEATGVVLPTSAYTATTTGPNTVVFSGFSSAISANQYRYTLIGTGTTLAAPQVRDTPVTVAYASSLTLSAPAGNSRICTATGDLTLNAPATGLDGQVIRLRVIASGGSRVVTFAGALKRPSGIASTLTIASGLRGDILLAYESAYGWTVLAAVAA